MPVVKNILVFPCGSEIGLDIYDSVKYSTYFHLIGASSVSDHGMFVYEDYIGDVPFVTDDAFIPRMAAIVKEKKIDAIYPAMDIVISVLKAHEEELGCIVIASSSNTAEICLSKARTYEILKSVVRVPIQYDPMAVSSFPCFAKPEIGYGGKGTKKLNNQDEVSRFINGKQDIMIMEYLPGEEYTVDCFTDRNRCLIYTAARIRNRIKDGISVNTSFVEDQSPFEVIAKAINDKLEFRGAWFYQVKRTVDGNLCLLEVASRLGGSSLISNAIGVNLSLLSLFDAFEFDVKVLRNNYHVELDRALCSSFKINLEYDTVYVDYDDCLVLNKNQINPEIVSFIYRCINRGKHIILLTKHDGDIDGELKRFRLAQVFDKVLHIPRGDHKYIYITSPNSILIDDSFAERKEANAILGISVFSPDMVKVLS